MTSFIFERWPRIAMKHPWKVIVGAVVGLALLAGLSFTAGGDFSTDFSIPGTESQRLIDLLEERFPQNAGDTATVIVRAPDGLSDAGARARVDSLIADLERLPEVEQVFSNTEDEDTISIDGTTRRIVVQYAEQASDVSSASVDALLDARDEHSVAGFVVEVGGTVIQEGEQEPPGTTEVLGFAAAAIILLLAFRSVVAMGLPIITAVLALASGLMLVVVGASFLAMPEFTVFFAALIGIGVGIDYSLIVVTRYREGLASGLGVDDAITNAASTAGRSVAFAGSIVVVALLGLWAVGIPFIGALGTATSFVVVMAVVVAVFVLPAMLKLAGKSIDRWQIPGFGESASNGDTGLAYRLSRLVQRYPLISLAVSLAILVVLALPVLDIRLGTSDAGNNPESFASRRAYDLLSEGFGPGFNGPILVGFGIDERSAVDTINGLPPQLRQLEGVANVSAPRFNEDETAATLIVIPESAPQEVATNDLVRRIREEVPNAIEGSGAEAIVGGPTAAFMDTDDLIRDRLPFFMAAVVGLSFVLLLVMFRSVLVPIKAAVMNALSIGASYGVLVAVFQWGWFGGILGVGREGPIESFMPVILFAVLFGISMDYEVFLVSRIREEYQRLGDNSEAVARGLAATARVITAAAAIMIAVFISFALGDERVVKEFGIGLAVAIFLDATLVRMVLVPSVMQLQGDANWWFPDWLDRLVPKLSFEGRAVSEAVEPVAGGD